MSVEPLSPTEKANRYHKWMDFISPLRLWYETSTLDEFASLEGKSLLDVGCRDGAFLRVCADRGAVDLLGVDHRQKLIDLAKKKQDSIEFQLTDIFSDSKQNILEQDASMNRFDFACMHFLLVHCQTETQMTRAFSRIHGCLKDGGKVSVVTIPFGVAGSSVQEIYMRGWGFKISFRPSDPPVPFIAEKSFAMKPEFENSGQFTDEAYFEWNNDHMWPRDAIERALKTAGFGQVRDVARHQDPQRMNEWMLKSLQLEGSDSPIHLVAIK